MFKSHEKYNSQNGKRLILIVDDEKVNRDILGLMVSGAFEAVYAENGMEALSIMREKRDYLSLVLLDLLMPVMDGYEVMRRMREDAALVELPVIVLTSERSSEVDCLKLGAFDFIIKPFNVPDVILARINRTIELSEDRYILSETERDSFTLLLNRDFFFNYAYKYDVYHKDLTMDAITFNVNNFHIVNEMYGREKGDEILKEIATFLRKLVDETGCMATRLESDKFLCYMPNRNYDYTEMFKPLNDIFESLPDVNARIRIGIYKNADKNIPIESRFDRAMRASNLKKNSYVDYIAYYEDADYKKDLFLEKLSNEMKKAVKGGQFEVYFQPKYSIKQDEPRIVSAEALVRWNHPELGMVSPGVFINLFEHNGLIKSLDRYVWEQVVKSMVEWRDRFGTIIPVSVNISRIELFDSKLEVELEKLLDKYGIPNDKLYLEITESAYVDAIEQLSDAIDKLRDGGFIIEMDDFGAGYSSLNMLSNFPIDVLKLDMKFVHDMMGNEKKKTVVDFVLKLAKALGMDVIAEGVDNIEQVKILKELGCKIIQGYYFSKPVPKDEFTKMLEKDVVKC